VWPEQNLLIFKPDEPAFIERARRLAADEHVYLAMGMARFISEKNCRENKLVLIDPSGQIVVSYLKSHAVPGWEASIMRVGDGRLPVIATKHGRIATAICADADFPEFLRRAGQGSADLLLLPVNDWKEIKSVHMQMAAFRAIENGVSLVRAASSGLSIAFDPWVALWASRTICPCDRTMTVQLPVAGVRTLYARTGDLFAWLCVVGLVVALGIAAAAPGNLSVRSAVTERSSLPTASSSTSNETGTRHRGLCRDHVIETVVPDRHHKMTCRLPRRKIWPCARTWRERPASSAGHRFGSWIERSWRGRRDSRCLPNPMKSQRARRASNRGSVRYGSHLQSLVRKMRWTSRAA